MPYILYLEQCMIIGWCLVPVCLTICYSIYISNCKGTPLFLPLNDMTMLQSYFSLFN